MTMAQHADCNADVITLLTVFSSVVQNIRCTLSRSHTILQKAICHLVLQHVQDGQGPSNSCVCGPLAIPIEAIHGCDMLDTLHLQEDIQARCLRCLCWTSNSPSKQETSGITCEGSCRVLEFRQKSSNHQLKLQVVS